MRRDLLVWLVFIAIMNAVAAAIGLRGLDWKVRRGIREIHEGHAK